MPATNQEIAERLMLSLPAIKSRPAGAVRAFSLEDLPQNQKRIELAEQALEGGVVRASDLLRDG